MSVSEWKCGTCAMDHNTTVFLISPILSSTSYHHREHNLLSAFNGLFRRMLFHHPVDGAFNEGELPGSLDLLLYIL